MSPDTGARPSAAALFLALLSCCCCCRLHFQGTDSVAMRHAWISSPLTGSPVPGQNFSIPCEGYTPFPESSIMYWLANDSFVNTLYSSGAVREAETIETANGTGLFLKRTLSFHSFTQRDLQTKFECIILDPASVARKTITWVPREVQKEETKYTEGSGVQQDDP